MHVIIYAIFLTIYNVKVKHCILLRFPHSPTLLNHVMSFLHYFIIWQSLWIYLYCLHAVIHNYYSTVCASVFMFVKYCHTFIFNSLLAVGTHSSYVGKFILISPSWNESLLYTYHTFHDLFIRFTCILPTYSTIFFFFPRLLSLSYYSERHSAQFRLKNVVAASC